MCRQRKQTKGREKCPLSPSIIEENLHEAIMQAIRKICRKMEFSDAIKHSLRRLEALDEEIKLYESLSQQHADESCLDALSILKLEKSKIRYQIRRSNSIAERISEAELVDYMWNAISDRLISC